MEQIIFEPLKNPVFSTTNLSILFVIASGLATFYIYKSKAIGKHYRSILSMLSFFACIMALGTVFFSWFHGERIGTIKIDKEQLQTAYGNLNFNEIKEVLIKKENKSNSMLVPSLASEKTSSMVIISKENDYYFFSEDNYPVFEMIGPIRKAWQASNKKGSSD